MSSPLDRRSRAVVLALIAAIPGCGLILGIDDFKDAPPAEATGSGGGGEGGSSSGEGGGGSSAGGGGPAPGETLWSRIYGDAASQGVEVTAVDSSGNVFITGYFAGTTKFGDHTLISAGGGDVYLAKLDAAGNPIWSKQFGDSGNEYAMTMTVDATDNVIIAGSFTGSITFGSTTFQGGDQDDIFVAKFDPAGNPIWSRHFGGPGAQWASDLTIDRSTGDVVLVGGFYDAINFGNGPIPSAGNADMFIAKLDGTSGDTIWSQRHGDAAFQTGAAVRVDPAGNIVTGGLFQGNITFNQTTLSNTNEGDIFIAKLDPGGQVNWAKQFGGTSAVRLTGLHADDSGHTVFVSLLIGTANFGCGNVTNSNRGLVVVKLDPTGNCLWNKRFSGGTNDGSHGLAVDRDGNLIVAGYFTDALNCGGVALAAAGSADIFVLKLDPAGERLWCKSFGGETQDEATGVAVDPGSGEVVLAAWTLGSVDFGTGPLTSAGQSDILLAKLAP